MTTDSARGAFRLPPLILHPFSNSEETSLLVESSRASLALQGLLPGDAARAEDLDAQLLRGRYAELRMLFYIGKDIARWAEQCAEVANAAMVAPGHTLRAESFAALLVQQVPAHVRAKLENWGVLDFCSLFRRSFGLHAVFQDFPPAQMLSLTFLRRYHRHLDLWYEQRMRDGGFERLDAAKFTFDLYASGEYTSMLEQSWGVDTGGTSA
jgi:hypothetical protein